MPHAARTTKLSTITSIDELEEDIDKLSDVNKNDETFITAIEAPNKNHKIQPVTAALSKTYTCTSLTLPAIDMKSHHLQQRNAEIDDIINSADMESNVDITEVKPNYDETGKRTYERACRKIGVSTISNFLRSLERGSALDLQFYGLECKSTLAISMALVINSTITTVNLQGNTLNTRSLGYLEKMLEENITITNLNLSENDLRTPGMRVIARIIENNKTLKYLNISNNNFYDTDGIVLAKAIEEHSELLGINISQNSFGDICAGAFKSMLAENSCLQEIDLSWNNFLRGGATCLAEGMAENVCIRDFNASWNGFEDDGAAAMAKALETNTVLKTLDLSCNRIGPDGFLTLIGAFKHNDSLDTLKVGKNNVPDQAAESAIMFFLELNLIRLRTLDLSDVIFRSAFNNKINELHEIHKDITIIHGYTDSYGKRRMVSYDAVVEAINVINLFLAKQKIRIVELFKRFDLDGSMSVSYEEFQQGLKEAGIYLSATQLDLLIRHLDKDGDGEIDFSELVALTEN
ncbi:leucine-rich repeat-containing protein 74A isoform X2 [Patella vulgata]|nr:leucine-rich repeat-containing protein 74A isoform X2 [Patella vulgata]